MNNYTNTEQGNIWYAIQSDPEDDWSFGFYTFSDAVEWCAQHPGHFIAVIDESTHNPVCIDEIYLR